MATEASLEPYRRCIALDPKHAYAHNNLADSLMYLGDLREAEMIIRKAIEMDRKSPTEYYTFSEILEKQNDIPGAIEFTEKYIDAGDPDNDGEQRLEKLRAKLK